MPLDFAKESNFLSKSGGILKLITNAMYHDLVLHTRILYDYS
ncbi:hypothetical protein [Leptospira licerasiae]|nr:hypothetical protein [Leptospira licerasiae]